MSNGLTRSYTIDYNVTGNAAAELNAIAAALATMSAQANNCKGPVSGLASALSSLGTAASTTVNHFSTINQQFNQFNSHVQTTNQQFNQTNQQFNQFNTALTQINNSLSITNNQTANFTTVIDNSTNVMSTFNNAIGRVVAGFSAFNLAKTILSEVGQAIKETRDELAKLGDEFTDLRQKAREYANLTERPSPDNVVMSEAIGFGLKAGMTPDKAIEFLTQYQGSVPAGIQKGNITKEVGMQVAEEAARFGQRVSLTAATAGDMAGVVSQFQKINNREEGAKIFGQVAYGLNEGRGEIQPLMHAFLNTAGSLVDEGLGPVKSLSDLAVPFGVLSQHHGPEEAGTHVRNAFQALRGKGSAQLRQSLRIMGIAPDTDAREAMTTFFGHMDEEVAKGKTPEETLRKWGVTEIRAARGWLELWKNKDVIKTRYKNVDAVTAQSVMAANDAFAASPAGQSQRVRAQLGAAKATVGLEQEDFAMARTGAIARLHSRGEILDQDMAALDAVRDMGGILTRFGVESSLEQRIDKEAVSGLVKAADAVGLGDWARGQAQLFDENSDPKSRALIVHNLSEGIRSKGGDPAGDGSEIVAGVQAMGNPGAAPHVQPKNVRALPLAMGNMGVKQAVPYLPTPAAYDAWQKSITSGKATVHDATAPGQVEMFQGGTGQPYRVTVPPLAPMGPPSSVERLRQMNPTGSQPANGQPLAMGAGQNAGGGGAMTTRLLEEQNGLLRELVAQGGRAEMDSYTSLNEGYSARRV
jgi:prefoldin subunit 5